jgi:hypothetical protein
LRYLDTVFETVFTLNDQIYGLDLPFAAQDPLQLRCDFYFPLGDTVTDRPLIIWLPAGNFQGPIGQPGAPLGTRKDSAIVELCTRFARMGYVAVAADYRTGWSVNSEVPETLRTTFVRAAWRGVQDTRCLVRYLKVFGRPYGYDTSKIVVGGIGAGGYNAFHAACWNQATELNRPKLLTANGVPIIDTLLLGGFSGRGGNTGVSDRFAAAVSLGGGVLDTAFIQPGEPPLLALHNPGDPLTPYRTFDFYTALNFRVAEVSGSYDVLRRSFWIGNQSSLIPAYSGDTIPGLYAWNGAPSDSLNWFPATPTSEVVSKRHYIDTVQYFIGARLAHLFGLPKLLTSQQSIMYSDDSPKVESFTAERLTYTVPAVGSTVRIFNMLGHAVAVASAAEVPGTRIQLIFSQPLSPGIYTIQVTTSDNRTYARRWVLLQE